MCLKCSFILCFYIIHKVDNSNQIEFITNSYSGSWEILYVGTYVYLRFEQQKYSVYTKIRDCSRKTKLCIYQKEQFKLHSRKHKSLLFVRIKKACWSSAQNNSRPCIFLLKQSYLGILLDLKFRHLRYSCSALQPTNTIPYNYFELKILQISCVDT